MQVNSHPQLHWIKKKQLSYTQYIKLPHKCFIDTNKKNQKHDPYQSRISIGSTPVDFTMWYSSGMRVSEIV